MGKRKPRGRNFTPDERALMLKIITQGGSVEDVNAELGAYQILEGLSIREMPASSFLMVKNTYSQFLKNDDAVRNHIFHPAPMGKLRSRAAVES